MAFPTNPSVGDLYTSARGYTYQWIADGAWIARDNPSLMAASSGEVAEGLQATKYVTPASLLGGALSKLTIHADVRTPNNRISLSQSTGAIVVAGATIIWRGWKEIDTTQITTLNRTLATVPNKTYHLRWDAPGTGLALNGWPLGKYSLYDMADNSYTGGNTDASTTLDSSYDSILIGRVITNASNIATIIELANSIKLRQVSSRNPGIADAGASGINTTHTHNFGRTPIAFLESVTPPGGGRDSDLRITVSNMSRYNMSVTAWNWTADANGNAGNHNSPGYTYNVLAQ